MDAKEQAAYDKWMDSIMPRPRDPVEFVRMQFAEECRRRAEEFRRRTEAAEESRRREEELRQIKVIHGRHL